MHVRQIDAMVMEGIPFDEIEDHIESLALPAEAKSVLWLYLWVQVDVEERRRVVEEMLLAA